MNRRKSLLIVVLIVSLVAGSVSLGYDPIWAASLNNPKLKTTINAERTEDIFKKNFVNQLSGSDDIKNLKPEDTSKGTSVNEKGMDVDISKDLSDGIRVEDSDSDVELNMRIKGNDFDEYEIIDNTVVYKAKDESIGIEVFDGGVRQTFVLENSNSKKDYAIKYDAKNIAYMNFAFNENGDTDGSVLIYDKKGDILAAIDAPWAKDNNGNDVKTFYKIKKNTLVQVIKPAENNEYPIVADPKTYSSFFKSSKWIYRKGASYPRALSIKPKIAACGYASGLASWSYLRNKHRNDRYWYNNAGMKDQYLCHAMVAQFWKTPWNLEPGRPNVSFPKTVAQGCNPK